MHPSRLMPLAAIAAVAAVGCETPTTVDDTLQVAPAFAVGGPAPTVTLLSEDFEAYAEGSDLNGQGGWVHAYGPGPFLVGTGALGSRGANGLVANPGVNDQQGTTHAFTWDGTGTLRAAATAYVRSGWPWSTNAGFSIGDWGDQAHSPAWSAHCGACASSPNAPGWVFRSGTEHLEWFEGVGYDTPVRLEIIVDAEAGEVWGRVDFGAGLVETAHYSTAAIPLTPLTGLQLYQDYRWGFRGADMDDVSVTWTPSTTITLCHKPGTPAEKTLTLPRAAADGHLRHGDTVGACG